jgi:hypothetical protein
MIPEREGNGNVGNANPGRHVAQRDALKRADGGGGFV